MLRSALGLIFLLLPFVAIGRAQDICSHPDPDMKALCEKQQEAKRIYDRMEKKAQAKIQRERAGIECTEADQGKAGVLIKCTYIGHPEDEQILHGKVARWMWQVEVPESPALNLLGKDVQFTAATLGPYVIHLNIADATGRYQQSFRVNGKRNPAFEWDAPK